MVVGTFTAGAAALAVDPTAGTGEIDKDDGDRRVTHLHSSDDPAFSDTRVVHLTSPPGVTHDYALAVVDVRDVQVEPVPTLEFDYFGGADNEDTATGEV